MARRRRPRVTVPRAPVAKHWIQKSPRRVLVRYVRKTPLELAVLHGEDRRRYHPGGRSRVPKRANLSHVVNAARGMWHMPSIKFPNLVAMCVRRQVRKEVMIALKQKGSGGGSRKLHEWSMVKC